MTPFLAFCSVFGFLTFWHFFVDWTFQTHAEAMKKSWDPVARGIHCIVYTVMFIPVLNLLSLTSAEAFTCMAILFGIHFVEDTYMPVALWAKYIRRAPSWNKIVGPDGDEIEPTLMGGLKAFVQQPLGLLLAVTIDQIVHVATLIPVAYIAVT